MSDLISGFDDYIGSAPSSSSSAYGYNSSGDQNKSFLKRITLKHLVCIVALLSLVYFLYRYWPRKSSNVEKNSTDEGDLERSQQSSEGDPLSEAQGVVAKNARKAAPATTSTKQEPDDESIPVPLRNARLPAQTVNQPPQTQPQIQQQQQQPQHQENFGLNKEASPADVAERVRMNLKIDELTKLMHEVSKSVDTFLSRQNKLREYSLQNNAILTQVRDQMQQNHAMFQQVHQLQQFQQQANMMRRAEPAPFIMPAPAYSIPAYNSQSPGFQAPQSPNEFREQRQIDREREKEKAREKERAVEKRS